MEYLAAVLGVVTLLAAHLAWLADRLGRLHARCAAARAALDAQLVRRAALAARVSESAPPHTPAGVLHRVANAALTTDAGDLDQREVAENDLTRALRRTLPYLPDPARLEVAGVSRRLAVARQLYNDAVRDTLSLRTARIPRAFRLGARNPVPRYFDIDELDADRPARSEPAAPVTVPPGDAVVGEATPEPA